MKHLLLVCILFCCCSNAFAAAFDSKTGTFVDDSRSRTILYIVYYPRPLEGRYPVIIVSHGLGGSRNDVSIPLFHMTGTDDESLVDARSVSPQERTEPFRLLNIPNQYLLVLNKADHITFSGTRSSARDKKQIEAIQLGALAFFQAYLLDDKKAEAWLRDDYKQTLDAKDIFEFK